MKKIIIFILISFGIINSLEAENSNFGVFAGYEIISNTALFKEFNGCINCSKNSFTNSNGSGFKIDGIYEYNNKDYSLEGRIGIAILESGKFISKDMVVTGLTYEPIPIEFTNTINWKMNTLNLEANFNYRLFQKVGLSLGFGSNFIIHSNYNQIEKINDKTNTYAFATTGTNERTVGKGEIPGLNKLQFYGNLKLNYEIILNKYLILKPEASYKYSFTDIVNWSDEDSYWKMNKVSFGFSLLYNPTLNLVEEDYTNAKKIVEVENNKEIEAQNKLKIQVEENKKKSEELEKIKKELAEKERVLTDLRDKEKSDQDQLNDERNRLLNEIDHQNVQNSSKCKCYFLLLSVSDNSKEAEDFIKNISGKGIIDLSIEINNENSLKMNFYRVRSKCFEKAIDAINLKLKAISLIENNEFDPQIICDK